MTLDEIEDKLSDNPISYGSVPASTIAELQGYVTVALEMDKATQDYYYQIRVDDLVGSKMPTQVLDDLRADGWAFNPEHDAIRLFLKS